MGAVFFGPVIHAHLQVVDTIPACMRIPACFYLTLVADTYFPVNYLPSWFPGAGFKRAAAEWRPLVQLSFEQPIDVFRALFARSTLHSVGSDNFDSALDTRECQAVHRINNVRGSRRRRG